MSENLQPRRPEEPETYVEDVDKAYFMANSNAKKFEERAARKRAELADLVNGNNDISKVEKRNGYTLVHYANRDNRTVEVGYTPPGEEPTMQSGNYWPGRATVTGPKNTNSNEDFIVSDQKQADVIYDAADAIYDVLKRTKR